MLRFHFHEESAVKQEKIQRDILEAVLRIKEKAYGKTSSITVEFTKFPCELIDEECGKTESELPGYAIYRKTPIGRTALYIIVATCLRDAEGGRLLLFEATESFLVHQAMEELKKLSLKWDISEIVAILGTNKHPL